MIFNSWATILSVTTYLSGLPAQLEISDGGISYTTASKATSGCGLAPTWDFDEDNHANITIGDRSFLVHIPAAYDATSPHAVVLSFHGFKRNDLKQEKVSGLSEKGLKLNGKVWAGGSLSDLSLTLYAGYHRRLGT